MTTAARVYPNVLVGPDAVVGDFVVLGHPPRGSTEGELPLVIGPGAVIRSHTVLYAGSIIGARFQTGHAVLVRERCRIADDCSIGSHTVLEFAVTLGPRVRIHSGVFIPEHSVLDDGCWLGPHVVVTNARYPGAPRTKEYLAAVTIRRAARIGANATLLPGITVGENALVGAGSVVVEDVPDGAVVAGNPARAVGRTDQLRYANGSLVYEPRR